MATVCDRSHSVASAPHLTPRHSVCFHYHHRVIGDASFLGRKKNFDLVMQRRTGFGDDLPRKICNRANFRIQLIALGRAPKC